MLKDEEACVSCNKLKLDPVLTVYFLDFESLKSENCFWIFGPDPSAKIAKYFETVYLQNLISTKFNQVKASTPLS